MCFDSLAPARLALRANLWLLHLKDPVFSIVDILFRFFTSFVSCSVFRLSFSSFCYPSVDSGRLASLPGLGLIVFVGNWVQGDWKVFLTELTEWEVAAKWASGRQKFRGTLAKQCSASLSFLCPMAYFVPVFHQFCILFGVSPVV